jgi:riboflavin biosynthesis pyrimidine reductase
MQNFSQTPTLIVTTKPSFDKDFQRLARAGADVITIDADENNRVDLIKLLPLLANRAISSVLIEGGAGVITSALRNNLVNRLIAIIAPKIIGKGIEAIGDLNVRDLEDAKLLSVRHVMKKGADIIIDSRLTSPPRSSQP